MKSRLATAEDLADIQQILESYQLPTDDCHEHLNNFILLQYQENIMGIGGLEIYEHNALIRSVAVTHAYTGKGLGKKIYRLLENQAKKKGVKALYLLTETATDFFLQLGFLSIDRSEAPAAISKTKQFLELCPSSAQLMRKKLLPNKD